MALKKPLIKHTSASKKRQANSFNRVAAYAGVFLVLASVIALGYQKPQTVGGSVNQAVSQNGLATVDQPQSTSPSVDEIVATGVAANLTEQTNLPIASNLANTAVSLSTKNELAQSTDTSTTKPQIMQSDANGRSIQEYTTKAGDSVPLLAAQYNVSSETIRWANNLASDALEPGKKLTILPVNGITHTVTAGETADSLAVKYQASAARIVSYNDLELSGVTVGQNIIIPDGVLPENERPGYVAPVARNSYGGGTGYRVPNVNLSASAGNRYAPGNCTWYAYERRAKLGRPVGSFWGNANTWGYNARAAGLKVDNIPEAGAVLVDTAGYYGHVAVVESVDPNTGDVLLSEMNNYAYGGFNIVNNRTLSAGQASAYQYIH